MITLTTNNVKVLLYETKQFSDTIHGKHFIKWLDRHRYVKTGRAYHYKGLELRKWEILWLHRFLTWMGDKHYG